MLVEVIVTANSEFSRRDEYRDETFLCVFNDGSVIVSNPVVQHDPTLFVIQCDISSADNIKNTIISDSLSLEYRYSPVTHIGLTLFALKPFDKKDNAFIIDKHSRANITDIMIKQIKIGQQIKLPVCGKLVVNHKPKIHETESDYYLDRQLDIHKDLTIHTTIINTDTTNSDGLTSGSDLSFKIDPKYFLSVATEMYPFRRDNQMVLMVEQYIDYHLFQGFDHFFMYHHTFNQDNAARGIFYGLLYKNGYITNNIVTLIEWPMAVHQKNLDPSHRYGDIHADLRRFHQVSVYMDSTRRFMYDSELIYFGDPDEFVIPLSSNRTVKDTLKYLINKESANNTYRHAFAVRTYPALPDVYTLLGYQHTDNYTLLNKKITMNDNFLLPNDIKNSEYLSQEIKFMSDRMLGCDENDIHNKYDTFLQRHSCTHWKTQSIYFNQNGRYSKYSQYSKIKNLNQLDKLDDEWFKKLKEYLYQDGCTLFNCSNPVGLFQRLMVKYPGSSDFYNQDFEAMKKNIVRPRYMFIATMHLISEERIGNLERNEYQYLAKKLSFNDGLFAIHARDHWNKVNPKTKYDNGENVVDWTNSCDMKLFYGLIQSNCNQQEFVLYWNNKFLQTDVSTTKYKNKLLVNQLIDKDAVYCYLKN